MQEICPKCGLLKEICACDVLEKEEAQKIKVYSTKKKFGKLVTIVDGLGKDEIGQTAKELKRKLACGGTAKDGIIVLQGDHKERVKEILASLGYNEENIYVR
ncbi:stress response translation initiation inhibitor YciH [Candidatus Micrarchaeota archaeon]|nr:stress response translation initiation inhibitor YciH [Candidatus Micrarchaeota archaeon]